MSMTDEKWVKIRRASAAEQSHIYAFDSSNTTGDRTPHTSGSWRRRRFVAKEDYTTAWHDDVVRLTNRCISNDAAAAAAAAAGSVDRVACVWVLLTPRCDVR